MTGREDHIDKKRESTNFVVSASDGHQTPEDDISYCTDLAFDYDSCLYSVASLPHFH